MVRVRRDYLHGLAHVLVCVVLWGELFYPISPRMVVHCQEKNYSDVSWKHCVVMALESKQYT